jgi:hypothetical protein
MSAFGQERTLKPSQDYELTLIGSTATDVGKNAECEQSKNECHQAACNRSTPTISLLEVTALHSGLEGCPDSVGAAVVVRLPSDITLCAARDGRQLVYGVVERAKISVVLLRSSFNNLPDPKRDDQKRNQETDACENLDAPDVHAGPTSELSRAEGVGLNDWLGLVLKEQGQRFLVEQY